MQTRVKPCCFVVVVVSYSASSSSSWGWVCRHILMVAFKPCVTGAYRRRQIQMFGCFYYYFLLFCLCLHLLIVNVSFVSTALFVFIFFSLPGEPQYEFRYMY